MATQASLPSKSMLMTKLWGTARVHVDRLQELAPAVDLGLAAERLGVAGVGDVGVGEEIGDHAQALVGAEPALGRAAALGHVGEVAGDAGLVGVEPAPVAAVVAAVAEVGGDPEGVVHVAGAGDDHVDDPVVAVEVDLHLAVGVEVLLPVRRLEVVLQAAAAPDAQVDLALVVG